MKVRKRDGSLEEVRLEKITNRIRSLSRGLPNIESISVAQKVISGIYPEVTTKELDELAMKTAASLATTHPDYENLAARIAISMIHKETTADFAETMERLYERRDKNGKHRPHLNEDFIKVVRKHKQAINAKISYERDYTFDYLGIETLKKSYLSKLEGKIVERPQHMWMRVAIGIHGKDIDAAFDTYEKMSKKLFTHATPTLFNAGTANPSLISCFLLAIDADTLTGDDRDQLEGIFKTVADCARISKMAGGIGVHIHDIRSSGVDVYGTGGKSNGIVPMLKVFDSTASYVDQGGGKRKGSFAFYLSPSHPDVFEFLDLRKNQGKEEWRCRNLFLALWVPDLFMDRVHKDEKWTLMDPMLCPGLEDCYGEEYEKLYLKYESEGKGSRTVRAQDLFRKILETELETSMPYILFKDAANRKTNQQNVGVIKSSNLCAEILEYSSRDEIACCNLASLSLSAFVEGGEKRRYFNHNKLHAIAKTAIKNLNKVIDVNKYPVSEAEYSNLRHRPTGLGVQGLADVFMKLGINWDSPEAFQLNLEIFETIYHGALEASIEEAMVHGPYETFAGSPASKGLLQHDLWFEDIKTRYNLFKDRTFFSWKDPATVASADEYYCSRRYNWQELRDKIKKHGLRNSLLVALMPTASTASILGNTESFEPIPSNIFKRSVLSGEFVRVNRYLIEELQRINLWNEEIKQKIIAAEGSIQEIEEIPENIKRLFRTVYEIPQKVLLELGAARGAFVCQTQSFNLYFKKTTFKKLSSAFSLGHVLGLKTGSYYIRQQPARQAQKFTVDVDIEKSISKEKDNYELGRKILKDRGFSDADLDKMDRSAIVQSAKEACSLDNPEGCIMCSG